jgi:UDP-glucose 4-epimerase
VNALVTGGAGCIGSDLSAALLARGDRVTVVDNLSSGKREHIERYAGEQRFRFLEGDLLDAEICGRAARDQDIVYHLAANPDVRFEPGDPTDKDLSQNTIATYNVLEAARKAGVGRFVFSSTSAVYGISEVMPIPESYSGHPVSLYGATKLGCEALISAFGGLFGMQCWILRFANIVGAKVRKKGRTVISDFIHRLRENPRRLTILGNGLQEKSYLHASECIEAMLFVVDRAASQHNVYNLGCTDTLQVNRIAEMVVDAMGLRTVKFEYTGGEGGWLGDVPRFRLDVSRLNKLGWTARHNSEEAVAMAIDAVLSSGLAEAASLPSSHSG